MSHLPERNTPTAAKRSNHTVPAHGTTAEGNSPEHTKANRPPNEGENVAPTMFQHENHGPSAAIRRASALGWPTSTFGYQLKSDDAGTVTHM